MSADVTAERDRAAEVVIAAQQETRRLLEESSEPDHALLWDTFVRFDGDLGGSVDSEELGEMLRHFDGEADDAKIRKYKEQMDRANESGHHDGVIEFWEFVEWWEMYKHDGEASTLRDNLRLRFHMARLEGVWGIFMAGPVEKRVRTSAVSTLERAEAAYSAMLQQCQEWSAVGFMDWLKKHKAHVAKAHEDMEGRMDLQRQNRALQAKLNRMQLHLERGSHADALSECASDVPRELRQYGSPRRHEASFPEHVTLLNKEVDAENEEDEERQRQRDEDEDEMLLYMTKRHEARDRDYEERREEKAWLKLTRLAEFHVEWRTFSTDEDKQRQALMEGMLANSDQLEVSYTYETAYLREKLERDCDMLQRDLQDAEGGRRRVGGGGALDAGSGRAALDTEQELERRALMLDARGEGHAWVCWDEYDAALRGEQAAMHDEERAMLTEEEAEGPAVTGDVAAEGEEDAPGLAPVSGRRALEAEQSAEHLLVFDEYQAEMREMLIGYMTLRSKVQLRRVEDEETLDRFALMGDGREGAPPSECEEGGAGVEPAEGGWEPGERHERGILAQFATAATSEIVCREAVRDVERDAWAGVAARHDGELGSIITIHEAERAAYDAYSRAAQSIVDEALWCWDFYMNGRVVMMTNWVLDQERGERRLIEKAEECFTEYEEADGAEEEASAAPGSPAAATDGGGERAAPRLTMYTTHPASPPMSPARPPARRAPEPKIHKYFEHDAAGEPPEREYAGRVTVAEERSGRHALEQLGRLFRLEHFEECERARFAHEEEDEYPVTGLCGPGGRIRQVLDLEYLSRLHVAAWHDAELRRVEVDAARDLSASAQEATARWSTEAAETGALAEAVKDQEAGQRGMRHAEALRAHEAWALQARCAAQRHADETYEAHVFRNVIIPDERDERVIAATAGVCRAEYADARLIYLEEEERRRRLSNFGRASFVVHRTVVKSDTARRRDAWGKLRGYLRWHYRIHIWAQALLRAWQYISRAQVYNKWKAWHQRRKWRHALVAKAGSLLRYHETDAVRYAYDCWVEFIRVCRAHRRVLVACEALTRYCSKGHMMLCWRRWEMFRDAKQVDHETWNQCRKLAGHLLITGHRAYLLMRWRAWLRWHDACRARRARAHAADHLSGHLSGGSQACVVRRSWRKMLEWARLRRWRRDYARSEWRAAEALLKSTEGGAMRRVYFNWRDWATMMQRRHKMMRHLDDQAFTLLAQSDKAIQRRTLTVWVRWLSLAWRRGLSLKRHSVRQMLGKLPVEHMRLRFTALHRYYVGRLRRARERQRKERLAGSLRSFSAKQLRSVALHKWLRWLAGFARRRKMAACLAAGSGAPLRRARFDTWTRWRTWRRGCRRRSATAHAFSTTAARDRLRTRFSLWLAWVKKVCRRRRLVGTVAVSGARAQLTARYAAWCRFRDVAKRRGVKRHAARAVCVVSERALRQRRYRKWAQLTAVLRKRKRVVGALRQATALGLRHCYWGKWRRYVVGARSRHRRMAAALALRNHTGKGITILYFGRLLRLTQLRRRYRLRYKAAKAVQLATDRAMRMRTWHRLLPGPDSRRGRRARKMREAGMRMLLRSTSRGMRLAYFGKLFRWGARSRLARERGEWAGRDRALAAELATASARGAGADAELDQRGERIAYLEQYLRRVRARSVRVLWDSSTRGQLRWAFFCLLRHWERGRTGKGSRQWARDYLQLCEERGRAHGLLTEMRGVWLLQRLRPELGETVARRQLADYERDQRYVLVRYLLGQTTLGALHKLDHSEWCCRARLSGAGGDALFAIFHRFEAEAELWDRRAYERAEMVERLHAPRLAIRKLFAAAAAAPARRDRGLGSPRSPAAHELRAARAGRAVALLEAELGEAEARRVTEREEAGVASVLAAHAAQMRQTHVMRRQTLWVETRHAEWAERRRQLEAIDEAPARKEIARDERVGRERERVLFDDRIAVLRRRVAELQRGERDAPRAVDHGERGEHDARDVVEHRFRSATPEHYRSPSPVRSRRGVSSSAEPAHAPRAVGAGPPPAHASSRSASAEGPSGHSAGSRGSGGGAAPGSGRAPGAPRPYLGLDLVDGVVRHRDGTTRDDVAEGCRVEDVKDGPAREAGMVQGDVIVKVAGQGGGGRGPWERAVADLQEWRRANQLMAPGDEIALQFQRRGLKGVQWARLFVADARAYKGEGQWERGARHTRDVRAPGGGGSSGAADRRHLSSSGFRRGSGPGGY